MELTHEFTVPATLEETWAAFDDIASVGECFPGAVVTSVEGDTFTGTVKVKLGPIALVYNGTGTFLEKDEAARTMKIQAKGKDKRGNGTAGADVVARMVAEGERSTKVTVHTDLAITGKPAQFGRGVIQDVSDKLLGQFVDCLEHRVGQPAPADTADTAAEAAEAADETDTGPLATPAAGGTGMSDTPVAQATADELAARRATAAPASPPAGAATPPAAGARPRPAGGDDALDLGATVVPILLRTYGKQIVLAVVALLLLRRLLGRRR